MSLPAMLRSVFRKRSGNQSTTHNSTQQEELLTHRDRILELVEPDPSLDASIAKNNHLLRYARRNTSQEGEDGVIEEVFRRLGVTKGWCVEFGAWDGKFHSNTWGLVQEHGWSAVLIEPDDYAFDLLTKNYAGLHNVHCFKELVHVDGPSSLDAILARSPIPYDFDLLVIDIDGNDWFIWQSLHQYHPRVVIIEINPFLPADINFVRWNDNQVKASASLAAVTELGRAKDYELICVVGGNAVFVRREDFTLFDIADNRPISMFRSRLDTKLFQGYDGTLFLAGNRKLVWRHQVRSDGKLDHVEVTDADIQVLPDGLRVFRPRLSYRNTFLESNANCLEGSRVPGNVLLQYRHNVTSECGEDGILQHIFQRLGISAGYCVDVGAYDGKKHSNCWTLIGEQKWRGFLIEKDAEAFSKLASRYAGSTHVKALQAEVTTSPDHCLDRLLIDAQVPRDFDFLSIDVEGNDYHLWRALTGFRPKVIAIDFNPTVSNEIVFAQEDDANIHHGASLHALVRLGLAKGYELAAVTTWNALFVQRELLGVIGVTRNAIEDMYYPVFETRIFQSIDSYLSTTGCDRLIRHNYVFDPEHLQPLPPNVRMMPFTDGRLGQLKSTFFAPE